MGLENIIKNSNPDWDNNVNSIYINNNICKSVKEINRALLEDLKNTAENNRRLKEHLERQNKNLQKLSEKEKKDKLKKHQEGKSTKKVYHNNYFN